MTYQFAFWWIDRTGITEFYFWILIVKQGRKFPKVWSSLWEWDISMCSKFFNMSSSVFFSPSVSLSTATQNCPPSASILFNRRKKSALSTLKWDSRAECQGIFPRKEQESRAKSRRSLEWKTVLSKNRYIPECPGYKTCACQCVCAHMWCTCVPQRDRDLEMRMNAWRDHRFVSSCHVNTI